MFFGKLMGGGSSAESITMIKILFIRFNNPLVFSKCCFIPKICQIHLILRVFYRIMLDSTRMF